MAKPILGTPILRGKAAKEMLEYLAKAKPDPEKEEQLRKALEFHRKVEVIK